jgi:hypothetical protein
MVAPCREHATNTTRSTGLRFPTCSYPKKTTCLPAPGHNYDAEKNRTKGTDLSNTHATFHPMSSIPGDSKASPHTCYISLQARAIMCTRHLVARLHPGYCGGGGIKTRSRPGGRTEDTDQPLSGQIRHLSALAGCSLLSAVVPWSRKWVPSCVDEGRSRPRFAA